ncbi:nucleotidyltransferase family protein [Novosphingobium beihaiensis]|uniref:Nucleotidyltransferase family protein n=1 Tax=Novosphingobium beihaiensis TaxID=2930389 RepID=A0ABT0BNN3_9SPHN|nr:nucleotidyltransferase family protein [Novosphingobium beihaiensis]MCJ2186657.1 nucleotidyltransferase family protein [Novosphingobium beihaiensis]
MEAFTEKISEALKPEAREASGSRAGCASSRGPSGLPVHLELLLRHVLGIPNGREPDLETRLDGEQWRAYANAANHHYVSALVAGKADMSRHDGKPTIDPEALDMLAMQVKRSAYSVLVVSAALRRLHRDYLVPLGIRYATFKGVTLGKTYYGSLAQRPCRDLDILVDPSSTELLVEQLLDAGYRFGARDANESASARPDAVRKALVTRAREFTLIDPAGGIIDVHTSLDLSCGSLDPARVLADCDICAISGEDYPVLKTPDLFTYVCYHHARHRYSRLHWLADIVTILKHPSFDADLVRQTARAEGFGRLVEASMAMPAYLEARLEGRDHDKVDSLTRMLGEACLQYLDPAEPGPEVVRSEGQVRLNDRVAYLIDMVRWDCSLRDGIWAIAQVLLWKLKPNHADMAGLELPRAVRGLYWLTRPFRLAIKIVRPDWRSR